MPVSDSSGYFDGYSAWMADHPKSDDVFASMMDGYGQNHGYQFISGYLVLPVASADDDAQPRIVRVHSPLGMRSINFQGSKKGRPPVMPAPSAAMRDPGSTSVNDFFLGGSVSFALPGLGTDGNTFNYTVGGSYTFVQRTAPAPGQKRYTTGYTPAYVGTERRPEKNSVNCDSYFTTDYFSTFFDTKMIRDSTSRTSGPDF